jgi:hypothetical protein
LLRFAASRPAHGSAGRPETIEETGDVAAGDREGAAFLHLGVADVHRARGCGARGRSRCCALVGAGGVDRQLAPIYGFTDTDGTRPDCWRYVVEVQDRDLAADDSGYR